MKKFKELKQNVSYAIPCKRTDGEEDYVTITVYTQKGRDEVWLNNRFMGAHPKKFTKGKEDWRFIIDKK